MRVREREMFFSEPTDAESGTAGRTPTHGQTSGDRRHRVAAADDRQKEEEEEEAHGIRVFLLRRRQNTRRLLDRRPGPLAGQFRVRQYRVQCPRYAITVISAYARTQVLSYRRPTKVTTPLTNANMYWVSPNASSRSEP